MCLPSGAMLTPRIAASPPKSSAPGGAGPGGGGGGGGAGGGRGGGGLAGQAWGGEGKAQNRQNDGGQAKGTELRRHGDPSKLVFARRPRESFPNGNEIFRRARPTKRPLARNLTAIANSPS